MLAELAPEELAAALDAVVFEVLSAARVTGPPVDAFAVAATLGIRVAWDPRQQGRARRVRLGRVCGPDPHTSILLRPDPRHERRQWAVAHEIGEEWAHRAFERLRVDPREAPVTAREQVANLLAGRLLLPTVWFHAHASQTAWDLFQLKHRYPTASHELIARRMLDFILPIVITVFDACRVTFRRSNVPGRVPAPSNGERACHLESHHTGSAARRNSIAGPIWSWPIHEPGWKREIVRWEINQDAWIGD